MARIFLSHSSVDNAKALALAGWLESNGWSDYFLDVDDRRGLSPGDRWMAALAAAVDRCEAVIFLVSPAWQRSKFCFAEFYQARSLGKRIFGVVVEPVDFGSLPEQMTSEWQLCDLTGSDGPQSFTVDRPPLVPRTVVQFPGPALRDLGKGLRRAGLDAATFVWPPVGDPQRSPYPGLRALDEADAAVFFGRDASMVRAIDQLRLVRARGVERLFVILGASGAGKSSFLRAGLLPRLRRDDDHFVVLPPLRPEGAAISGAQGLVAMLVQGLKAAGLSMSPAQVRSRLSEHSGLAHLLASIETAARQRSDTSADAHPTLVVPIDQGEELFAADGREQAMQLLDLVDSLRQQTQALVPGTDRTRVLFLMTIRSDALPQLQADPVLQALLPVLFSLPAMPPSEFKAVIEGPARRHTEACKRLSISAELADDLVADAQGADALPLLALTLESLYREFTDESGTSVGRAEYARLGGARGVIDGAVRRALARPGDEPVRPSQSAEQDALLRLVFPYLATVDPDSGQWKRRVSPRQAIRDAAPGADALVSRLVEQRLLLTDRRPIDDGGDAVEIVEIAHEALLRQWDRLERWLSELSESLLAAERLRRAAKDWRLAGEDPALLVHAKGRLQAAETLLADSRLQGRFDAVEAQYVKACRQRDVDEMQEREARLRALADEQARRARLQRRFTAGLLTGAAAIGALAVWIVLQTRTVARQTSLVIAAAAEGAADDQRFDQSVRLAILAARQSWLLPADATAPPALARAADATRLRVLLEGHTALVVSATFSADGRRVVTTAKDGTARVWDAGSGETVGRPVPDPAQRSDWTVSVGPDGTRVLTRGLDEKGNNIARIWDSETGKPIGEPMSHPLGPFDFVVSADFSWDGKRVLTRTVGGMLRVWATETGRLMFKPIRGSTSHLLAAISPDGRHFLVLDFNDATTLHVFDPELGTAVGEPMKHASDVHRALFSPDGRYIATASKDHTVRVWSADTGRAVSQMIRHEDVVTSVSFSPDSRRLLTSSLDGTARVWTVQTGASIGQAMAHGGPLTSARFSPDGKRIATASEDKTARVWDAATGKAIGEPMQHPEPVVLAVFSPDGKRVLTNWGSQGAAIWHVDADMAGSGTMQHAAAVWRAAFSQDGRRVLTGSEDHTARIWELPAGRPVLDAMKHESPVWAIGFSPDGRRVVTGAFDGTVRLWDAETGAAVGHPMHETGPVLSADFNADGRRILTWAKDATAVRLWDAATGHAIGPLTDASSPIESAAFSPDGRRVLTRAKDAPAVRLWDADTGQAVGTPLTHDRPVEQARFSTDGRRVLTSSQDGTARVWDAANGKALSRIDGEPDPAESGYGPNRAVFSADGRLVIPASYGDTLRIIDAETGKAMFSPLRFSERTYADFSPDGKRVYTFTGRSFRIWDTRTGNAVSEPIQYELGLPSFSPDGTRMLMKSYRDSVQVWDAVTGNPLGEPMKHGGNDGPGAVTFSAEGKRVLMGSADRVTLWDAGTGKAIAEPIKSDGKILVAGFSPDGKLVLTGHEDGTVRLRKVLPASFDDTDALIEATCRRLNRAARSITAEDVRRAPVVSPQRIGEDVCAGLGASASR